MPDRRHRGRQLRDVFITLALIFLVGAGAAYGATRYLQSGLESDATRDARKLSVDVLQPLLVPADAQGPGWFSTVSHSTGQSRQMRPSSRSLWGFLVAIASRAGKGTATRARRVGSGSAA